MLPNHKPRPLSQRDQTVATLLLCALLGALLGVHSTHAADAERSAKRPNVILIMADDVGYEAFGCYGSKQYRTPHIDRLAERGMRFTHCYAQPLCTPSRVKIMTGLCGARNYSAFSVLNRDQRTIGQYFRDAGYRTAIAGKWQLLGANHYKKRFRGKGTWPQDAGFERICLWQVDEFGERFHGPLLYVDGENRQYPGTEYGPEVATRFLVDFMKKHRDEPFFVYYPMILVHSPFVPTPDSEDRQSQDRQKNFEDMVTYMDKLVGHIAKTTEELGIADRTLLLFTGDNGTHRSLSSRLDGRIVAGGKSLTTDAGTRVPMVACWPGTIPGGRICEDLVDFSDFLPTTLEAAGVPIPKAIDGRSFLPQLRGRRGTPREWLYCYYNPRPERTKPARFARDQRWKLYGDGRFFDIRSDVLEKQPLGEEELAANEAARKAHTKLTRALTTLPAEGQTLLRFAP